MDINTILNGFKNGTLDPKSLIMNVMKGQSFTDEKIKQFTDFAKSHGATESDIKEILNVIKK
jgi:hypothetical protein